LAITIQVGRGYGVATKGVSYAKAELEPGEIMQVHVAVTI
jgi:hypothetical protein